MAEIGTKSKNDPENKECYTLCNRYGTLYLFVPMKKSVDNLIHVVSQCETERRTESNANASIR